MLTLPIAGTAQETPHARPKVYLSPNGDDMADGLAPDTAFRSPERAEAAVRSGSADIVLLMGGTYRLDRPVTIGPAPGPQRWAAMPGAHPVLDGGGRTGQALLLTASDVVVEGLGITRFTGNGIVVSGGSNVTIRNNRVADIASDVWTTAAILIVQVGRNVLVEGNRVENTGYAGIGFFASKDGDLGGARIIGNSVTGTCRRVADCGAIYVSGRTPTANGTVIRANHIADYGPADRETKAIYLDDGVSGVEVSRNVIRGTGSYAVQIHGGSDNLILHNDVALPSGQPILFHQEMTGIATMHGNRVENNRVLIRGVGALVKYGGVSRAIVRHNRRTAS